MCTQGVGWMGGHPFDCVFFWHPPFLRSPSVVFLCLGSFYFLGSAVGPTRSPGRWVRSRHHVPLRRHRVVLRFRRTSPRRHPRHRRKWSFSEAEDTSPFEGGGGRGGRAVQAKKPAFSSKDLWYSQRLFSQLYCFQFF